MNGKTPEMTAAVFHRVVCQLVQGALAGGHCTPGDVIANLECIKLDIWMTLKENKGNNIVQIPKPSILTP